MLETLVGFPVQISGYFSSGSVRILEILDRALLVSAKGPPENAVARVSDVVLPAETPIVLENVRVPS